VEIATAYAVLAGTPPDRIAEREFLTSGAWLRARGDAVSWSDPAAFGAAVERARNIAPGAHARRPCPLSSDAPVSEMSAPPCKAGCGRGRGRAPRPTLGAGQSTIAW
jgi:hypothetical protein